MGQWDLQWVKGTLNGKVVLTLLQKGLEPQRTRNTQRISERLH